MALLCRAVPRSEQRVRLDDDKRALRFPAQRLYEASKLNGFP
jgi:hypothetical protein